MMAPDTILAIDQGATSGWAVFRAGVFVESGHVRPRSDPRLENAERVRVVRLAVAYAGGSPDQLLVVFEDHGDISLSSKTRHDPRTRMGGPKVRQRVARNADTVLGMGASKARWEDRLDDEDHPERLRMKVTSEAWRKVVLGMLNKRGTDALKAAAVNYVHREMKRLVGDHNECEAICIGVWACRFGRALWDLATTEAELKSKHKAAKKSRWTQQALPGTRVSGEGA